MQGISPQELIDNWDKIKSQPTIDPEKIKRAQLLLAGVGVGKTFMYGETLMLMLEMEYHKKLGSISPWPYIVVTKSSIVEQTQRVLTKRFGIKVPGEVLVINIDQLRSKFGELFVNESTIIDQGEERTIWTWRPHINPCVIIWDECQILKNITSIQHKIASSFNEITSPTIQIFSSATPFTRVCEAKCFCVASRIPTTIGSIYGGPLTNERWPTFAKAIASPADPIEHSPAAIDRLMDTMDDYVIRVKNVKPQFKARNSAKLIKFTTEEGKSFYDKAIERFIKKKAKLEKADNMSAGQKNIAMLVAMLQYRIAAEGNPDRISYLCDQMYQEVMINGKASVCAVNFKNTIIKCVKLLNEKYGVPRDDISLIWGGGTTAITKKQKAKAAIQSNDEMLEILGRYGINLDDIGLGDDDVEAKTDDDIEQFPEHLRLGTQTRIERQREIDRFQAGKSLYCFYTFRAGGVGLSLHHTDELTTQKVKYKESGYAIEEDIPLIPTRPRVTYVAPTWSAMELVQGLGRAPRLTSLSETIQTLVFFAGTIEEKVFAIVSAKLKCLTKVVRQKEDWQGCLTGATIDDTKYSNITDDEENEEIADTFLEDDTEDNNNETKEAA